MLSLRGEFNSDLVLNYNGIPFAQELFDFSAEPNASLFPEGLCHRGIVAYAYTDASKRDASTLQKKGHMALLGNPSSADHRRKRE